MATILALSGSPSPTSRTAKVLDHLVTRLAGDHEVNVLAVRDLPGEALLGCDPEHPAIIAVDRAIQKADGVIIATPVYKAAYSGLLKLLLDLLPQFGLAGKVVLPLATGGTVAHVLAIDYALRPVLSSMGATHIVPGYFLHDRLISEDASGAVVLDEGAEIGLGTVVSTFLGAVTAASAASFLLPPPA